MSLHQTLREDERIEGINFHSEASKEKAELIRRSDEFLARLYKFHPERIPK